MAGIRGYMAMSLDGYIADVDGGYAFLNRYDGVEYGFADFMAEIGTCVFGRATWDQAVAVPNGLSYFAGKRFVVVTSRPLDQIPPDTEIWSGGVGPELVDRLRAAEGGDVWIVGGGRLQAALFELDAIDRLQAAIIPVLLGDGIRMFPPAVPKERWLELGDVTRFPLGGVILDYRRPTSR